jgi:hypothetical protein
MKTLYKNYNLNVEKAYIIRVKDNAISENLASRCAKSCRSINMPYQLWDAYDGISNPIKVPEHLKDHIIMKMIKVDNHYTSRGEVACALSHISLWSHCLEIEKSIVILEHDSIMIKPYLEHQLYNSICYLGSDEQVNHGFQVRLTPPHGSDGNNHHFICRAHSYAIDPAVARMLLCHVLRYGITASLDMMIRADIFPIHQSGVYAYDVRSNFQTTILGRPREGKVTLRNENLER